MEHWEVMSVSHNTPEEFWDNVVRYFKWCKDNPIEIKKVLMSGNNAGKEFIVRKIRPYNIKAMCLHCGILEEWLRDARQTKDKNSIWYIVVSKVLYYIYVQNLEMAMVDEFNPILTGKMLGLEKDEPQGGVIKVEIVQGLPALSESENEVLEKLEMENKLFEKS